MIDLKKKLSPHFTLGEMIYSNHRTIDNIPTDVIVRKLVVLCQVFLEPIRVQFGPIRINSGYRSFLLNKTIGGSKTSSHVFGCAADFIPYEDVKLQVIVDWIIENSGLNFDQVILESSSTSNWIHLGMAQPSRTYRKQALRFDKGVYTTYNKTKDYEV